jgi:hypothetical protein
MSPQRMLRPESKVKPNNEVRVSGGNEPRELMHEYHVQILPHCIRQL